MRYSINETHNPDLISWVESANDAATDFPIQNLPFGVFRRLADSQPTVGIAIGDMILDVAAAHAAGFYSGLAAEAAVSCENDSLNPLMALGAAHWSALRAQTSALLQKETELGQAAQKKASTLLVAMSEAEMLLPVKIGDFTDFLTSIYHATNAGQIFEPDRPLGRNFEYLPRAYHGRSSTIIVSGTPIQRPKGQIVTAPDAPPRYEPSRAFDYELEVGFYIGQPNSWGEPIAVADAEDHLFGLCLVNDWSARDIQGWEMQPLGPFLSKSTASTVSPWVISLEALVPFRRPAFTRAEDAPALLPHLYDAHDQAQGALDLNLEIHYSTENMRQAELAPALICQSSMKYLYWTPAQMIAHHTSNGCQMNIGDMFASGTVSGPTDDERGCMLELSWGCTQPYELPSGEKRCYVEDGDEIVMTGFCQRDGYRRIGLGECRSLIVPNHS